MAGEYLQSELRNTRCGLTGIARFRDGRRQGQEQGVSPTLSFCWLITISSRLETTSKRPIVAAVSKLNSALLGHSKGKGQKAAKGGAKDVTASASKKKKPAAAVVEETPSKRRRKKLYKPTFNTPAPSFEDVSDACFCFDDSLRRACAFAVLSARVCAGFALLASCQRQL